MAYYESQRKPFPNKVLSFGFPCSKRLAVSKGRFSLLCVEWRAKQVSLEQATALCLKAGDGGKSLSGKFSSRLAWYKMIVFISRGTGAFFSVPVHHLDVTISLGCLC